MDTYLCFLARHSVGDDNVLLVFARSKAVQACGMRKATQRLLCAAVEQASAMWKTYFVPKPSHMQGEKVDAYEPLDIQPLVNYRICMDVEIGGFNPSTRNEDERPS